MKQIRHWLNRITREILSADNVMTGLVISSSIIRNYSVVCDFVFLNHFAFYSKTNW